MRSFHAIFFVATSCLMVAIRMSEPYHREKLFLPPSQTGSLSSKRSHFSQILKERKSLLLLEQQVGHVARICSLPRNEGIDSNPEICWVTPREINASCNVNGPSPFLVRPWMHPLLSDTSLLLYYSSHVTNLNGKHLKLVGMSKEGGNWTSFSENIILPPDEKIPCKSLHSPSIHVDTSKMRITM